MSFAIFFKFDELCFSEVVKTFFSLLRGDQMELPPPADDDELAEVDLGPSEKKG